MMMIKGDREPGHLPSEELMAEMGRFNEQLSKAGCWWTSLRSIGVPKAFG
jgi:hypothetical protein